MNKCQSKPSLFAWVLWFVAASYVLYQFLLQSSTSIMVPQLMQAFHMGSFGVAVLSSSFFYGYIGLQIPAGFVVDRFGARSVLLTTLVLMVFMCLWFAMSHHIVSAITSRFLMGVMASPAVVAALYLAARWFSPTYFALLVGLTEMWGMVGGAVGQTFLPQIVFYFDWRMSMVACAILALVLCVLVWRFVYNEPKHNACQASPDTSHLMNQLKYILTKKQIWGMGFHCGLVFVSISAFALLWSVPFLMQLYQISVIKAGAASSLIFIGVAVGGPTFGWMSDQLGKRLLPMQTGAAASLVCLLLVVYVNVIPYWLMLLLLFLLGFFAGSYVVSFALVGDVTCPSAKGLAMGFVNMMCVLVGAPILQTIIGWLLEYHQLLTHHCGQCFSVADFHFAFSTLPLSVAVALLIGYFIKD